MHKSKLQELCHKKRLAPPDYAHIKSGPDHHPSFQSTVSVGGLSFHGPPGCRSAKDAHNEAARLALDHFSGLNGVESLQPNESLPVGDMSMELSQEDVTASMIQTGTEYELSDLSMYKSRLQELCQKKQWPLPKYDTTKEGPDHIPNFKTSVTVGGLSFDAPPECRSAKESQSRAAKIAFDHFLKTSKPPHVADSGPPLLSSEAHSNSLANIDMLKGKGTLNMPHSDRRDSIGQNYKQSDLLDMGIPCKNQLQSYAQRRNMNLPLYDHIREGSIHTFRYKGKVTVGTQTFESQQFFGSIKEAENEAAKVALISLFADGENVDDPVFHKNILLELTQKEGLSMPVYETVSEGSPHMPTFVSTVEVEGESFTGVPAKTKKQAEQNAAKVAWAALKDRKETKQGCGLLTDFKMCEDVEILYPNPSFSVDLQKRQFSSSKNLKGDEDERHNHAKDEPIDIHTCANDEATISKKLSHLTISYTEELAAVKPIGNAASSNMELKSECASREKKERSAASGSEQLQRAIPLASQFPDRAIPDAGGSLPSCMRIQIYPRRPDLKLPDGSTMLPISDDKWVALKVEPDST